MEEDKKQDVTVDQSYSGVLKRLVTSKSREEKEKEEKRAEEENRRAEDERKKAEEKKKKAEEAQKKAENEKKSVKDKKAEEEDLKRNGVSKEGEKQGKWHETKTVEIMIKTEPWRLRANTRKQRRKKTAYSSEEKKSSDEGKAKKSTTKSEKEKSSVPEPTLPSGHPKMYKQYKSIKGCDVKEDDQVFKNKKQNKKKKKVYNARKRRARRRRRARQGVVSGVAKEADIPTGGVKPTFTESPVSFLQSCFTCLTRVMIFIIVNAN